MFWENFCLGIICLPIPIGFLWVILYRNRKDIGFSDWLSGILAQGIISGHKIESGRANEDDYVFIIVATLALVAIFACAMTIVVG